MRSINMDVHSLFRTGYRRTAMGRDYADNTIERRRKPERAQCGRFFLVIMQISSFRVCTSTLPFYNSRNITVVHLKYFCIHLQVSTEV